jgi:prephenate dehydrogenase
VWRDIFVSNPDELLVQLKAFQNALQDLELALQNKDQSADLHDLIEAASLARKAWSHGA